MLYASDNVMPRTRIYDVDTKTEIREVITVNAKAGWLLVADKPLRSTEHGQIASRRIRFRSIYPIHGAEPRPCLFHCYGRLP